MKKEKKKMDRGNRGNRGHRMIVMTREKEEWEYRWKKTEKKMVVMHRGNRWNNDSSASMLGL
jgi:hypothetical protein